MKNKKFKLLLPSSKCCLKKFLELDFLAKNGSLFIVLLSIAIQSFNIINANNYEASFVSLIINLYFLVVVLTKLEYCKIDILNKYIDISLKIIIFIYILNFFSYLFMEDYIYKFVIATLNFLGAYCIFLLLKKDSI